MTQSEKEHLSAVAALGCMVCRRLGYFDTPCEVHHLRAGQGWGRSSHFETIGLCPEHHRGKTGVHGLGTKGFVRHYGFTEQDLLEDVQKLLEETRKRESIFPLGGKIDSPPSSGTPPQG